MKWIWLSTPSLPTGAVLPTSSPQSPALQAPAAYPVTVHDLLQGREDPSFGCGSQPSFQKARTDSSCEKVHRIFDSHVISLID